MELSVVIPVMNEEGNIPRLMEELRESLKGFQYEIIFVDDGSTDRTREVIKELMDDKTTLLVLNRNYGQSSALEAGIRFARGEIIVTIDGDLQNDPADIPKIVEKLKEGFDMVAGVRKERQDEPLRKFLSRVANRIIQWATGVKVSDYGCTLKGFRREVAQSLGLYGELHRFIPILSNLDGAKITEIVVNHRPRVSGRSKYGFNRIFKVISDLMYLVFVQRFGQKPMHFFGTLGFLMFIAGAGIGFYLLILKLLGYSIGGRPLLTLGVVLIIGGIQLITTGFLAEMLVRIYYESQQKRPYTIREIYRKGGGNVILPQRD
ncbi:MAG: glycosyltransferase family 2 protein [Campylobacterales bacterium]